eukprot:TRINITY_DN3084_c0_g1_i2.p1 TRINITY_DN3084_c0_g1~~TRINITY_DN3084_c0_g1_i2.p1  ORF type:complete len:319 (+),score=47.69 TRINITY_DN3084_c0_g1_i2:936-1892(+)
MTSIRWAFDLHSLWPSPCRSTWTRGMAALAGEEEFERSRIRKFHYQSDAKAALVGRLLLRKFAVEVASLSGEGVFCRSSRGRPLLRGSKTSSMSWDFNVSHQGKFVVLAAESRKKGPTKECLDELQGISSDPSSLFENRNVLVGVDVMRFRSGQSLPHEDQDQFFHLMRRQFSESEWAAIKSSDDPLSRSETFYRHWCLKESFVKALGVGITVNLQNLSFYTPCKALIPNHFVSNSTLSLQNRAPLRTWMFQESLLDSEHIAVVALNTLYPKACHPTPFSFIPSIESLLPTTSTDGELVDDYSEWIHFSQNQSPIKPF